MWLLVFSGRLVEAAGFNHLRTDLSSEKGVVAYGTSLPTEGCGDQMMIKEGMRARNPLFTLLFASFHSIRRENPYLTIQRTLPPVIHITIQNSHFVTNLKAEVAFHLR